MLFHFCLQLAMEFPERASGVTSPLKQASRYLLLQTRADGRDGRVDGFATKQVIDVFFYHY